MINILIRTSERPVFFKKCIESILNQEHEAIHLIISADTNATFKYACDIIAAESIEADDLTWEVLPMRKCNMKYFYNAYLNRMIERVKEGWFMVLDDDDELAPKAIERFEFELNQPTNIDSPRVDMLIFQMCRIENNPIIKPWNMKHPFQPVIGQIGMPCFLLHHSLKDKAKFTTKVDSDFRYIRDVMKYANYRCINEVMVNVSPRGFGRPEPKKKA